MGCGASTDVGGQDPVHSDRRPADKSVTLFAPNLDNKPVTAGRDADPTRPLSREHSKFHGTESAQAKAARKYEHKLMKNFKHILKYEMKNNIDDKYKNDPVRGLMVGFPSKEVTNTAKIVRIFTSSTFTDTKFERNELMEKVYPKLKTECQQLGYQFQVVDMRWGVRDDATDDHTTPEICLKEIKLCQELSTGPNFVTFQSHKYGYRPFPRRIIAEEFEKITQDYTGDNRKLLDEWFLKDENAVPTEYVLQPISTNLPSFKSDEREVSNEAWSQWVDISNKIQELLVQGAEKHLQTPNASHNYKMSVTEREIQAGIFEVKDPGSTALWFSRKIEDLDQVPNEKLKSKFFECGSDEWYVESRKLLDKLRKKLSDENHLPQASVHSYSVHWDEGINPNNPEHRAYLDKLCEDFESHLTSMIRSAVARANKEEMADPLYKEILQHNSFRHNKCKTFTGRHDYLEKTETYVKATTVSTPFVMHGYSGCGKTSLMAKAATESWQWTEGKSAIIYRFIGTSQQSSTVTLLLSSINEQIMAIYAPQMERNNTSMEVKALTQEFLLYISCIPKEKPLIILLDSLDQLDTSDGGQQLDWLPKELPSNVRIILSMLPQEQYICFSRCKAIFPDNSWVYPVPPLNTDDVENILDVWLKQDARTVTATQRQHILDTLQKHPIPLLLKLSCDQAVRWHSYDPPTSTVLQTTVASMISALFDRLEKVHGELLVKHSLSYITLARVGLTESELEDILSLSDEVLNDVYQYWTPPVRRLPPLLWVRIKNEINEYVVYRGADGAQVIYWYHRQFIETAQSRYLKDDSFAKKCHLDLAHYFMGTWADVSKPYKDKKGRSQTAMRHVSSQPIKFNDKFNLRKINQLPYHLIKAGQLELMKSEMVCSYEFLLSKIECFGLSAVLSDLKSAKVAFEKDQDISVVLEALQLSSHTVAIRPSELAGQLIGRIHDYAASTVTVIEQAKAAVESTGLDEVAKQTISKIIPALEKLMSQMDSKLKNLRSLCAQARQCSVSTLVPHTGFLVPPGGQLLHKLAGHLQQINDIDMSTDGKILASASDDKSVRLWNLYTGVNMRSVDLPNEVKFLVYLPAHRLVASCTMGAIYVIDTQTGEIDRELQSSHVKEYSARPIVGLKLDDKHYIAAPRNGFIDIYNLSTGRVEISFADDLQVHKTRLYGEQKVLAGAGNHLVYSAFADDEFYVVPFDTFGKIEMKKVRVFEEEAEWTNLDSKDHISDLAIAEKAKQIIVVNGKTKEFLTFDLETQTKLSSFQNNPTLSINELRISDKEQSIYFTANNEVGQLPVNSTNLDLQFRHPCKVTKLVSKDGRLIVTVAEDNILRVWDKIMEPFRPDLSAITGKVHVSKGTQGGVDSMMKNMFGDLDTSTAITNQELKDYWTKDLESITTDPVHTRFLPLPGNQRYVAVVISHHDPNLLLQWSRCLAIWDINTMQLVRRVFFPVLKTNSTLATYYVHCLVDRNQAFVQHNGYDTTFHLLDFRTWKTSRVAVTGTVKKVWQRRSLHVPGRQVMVVETQFDQLAVVAVNGEGGGKLKISESTLNWHMKKINCSFPYRTTDMAIHKFDELKVDENETRLLTVWGHWVVTVWDLDTCTQLHEFRVGDHFKTLNPLQHTATLGNVTGDQFLLVNANIENKSKEHNSICVFNIATGKFVSYTFAHNKDAELLQRIHVEGLTGVLQCLEDQPHRLQWIGVGKSGDSVVLDQIEVGAFTNRLRMSDDESYCVTWCTDPQEKSLRLYGVEGADLKLLGSFTQDEEVGDVHLIGDERTLLINTESGIVRLELTGKDVHPAPKSARHEAPVDFNDIHLNIVIKSA